MLDDSGTYSGTYSAAAPAAADYFSLFGLPRSPHLCTDELARRYRRLQSEVHPDRYAAAAALLRQMSLQQASRINDAYAVLKNPLRRAAYLLSLYGADVYNETDTALPADFLAQQLEWREALEEADAAARAPLLAEIRVVRDGVAATATAALTQLVAAAENTADAEAGVSDTRAGYDLLRRWIYLDKLLETSAGN